MASDSDDDMPIAQRAAVQHAVASPASESESEDDVPLARRAVPQKPSSNGNAASSNGAGHGLPSAANPNGVTQPAATGGYDSSSSEDDVPLGS